MNITFSQLRNMKDSLPDGTMQRIAAELNVTVETVRNYFGGANYERGQAAGLHFEPGPGGGIVHIEDTAIWNLAQQILNESTPSSVQAKAASE